MSSKYTGSMGYQRLIKELKIDSGGPPGADSVGTSQIVNNSIGTDDIADGAITEAKFSGALQLSLAVFTQRLNNLENPGFYGSLRIKNSNTSNVGATMTIEVQSEYYDAANSTTEATTRLTTTTITKGNHQDITIPISTRLINKDSIFRMYYTVNFGSLATLSTVNLSVEDAGNDGIGNFITFLASKVYAVTNGGSIEITFEIT
jgi:hypothetical protein